MVTSVVGKAIPYYILPVGLDFLPGADAETLPIKPAWGAGIYSVLSSGNKSNLILRCV